jgi:RimJ/RimL family protein N-acetyltransferase
MFIRTERLLLRPGWAEDAGALHRAIADERIVRNLARAPWPYEPADAAAYLATEGDPAAPSLLIFRRTAVAPELVGGIGFQRDTDGEVEFGYWIARAHWGRGYATEAGRAVLAAARDSLRVERLNAGHFLDNPASGRVLEKLGFRAIGRVALRHSAGRGEAVPCRLFELDFAGEDAPCASGTADCAVEMMAA